MFGGEQEEEENKFPCTYGEYKSIADELYKKGLYDKAIDNYTHALNIQPGEPLCLVRRSQCRLRMGNTKMALTDAETSLAEDKAYYKGVFQKAEALFNQGDFEMALVFYHRGNRNRPEMQEFRLGIQKAQEAISNCVGTPDIVKLDLTGDLGFFKAQTEKKQRETKKSKQQLNAKKTPAKARRNMVRSAQHDRTIRHMLADLYGDRVWLEELLKNTDETSEVGHAVAEMTEDGLDFLDTRTDFWQQVKPMYARKYEQRQALVRYRPPKTTSHEYTLQELGKLEGLMAQAKYSVALRRASKFMEVLSGYNETQLANLNMYKARVVSIQGNARLELREYRQAVVDHATDLEIGLDHHIHEAECRGLDNLGRTYARMGEFKKAIEVWERKLPLCKTPLETTWLCHELGRCYLETHRAQTAKDYGNRSLAAAKEADDDVWELHALVLISQAEVKAKRYTSSMVSFEQALELADVLQDKQAQAAIRQAMSEVRGKVAQRYESRDLNSKNAEKKTETTSTSKFGWFGKSKTGSNKSASNCSVHDEGCIEDEREGGDDDTESSLGMTGEESDEVTTVEESSVGRIDAICDGEGKGDDTEIYGDDEREVGESHDEDVDDYDFLENAIYSEQESDDLTQSSDQVD